MTGDRWQRAIVNSDGMECWITFHRGSERADVKLTAREAFSLAIDLLQVGLYHAEITDRNQRRGRHE